MVIPSNLAEARRLLDRLPPPPPGRNIVPMSLLTKKARRCHGCHGWNDDAHVSVPHGANRCTLEHDKRCIGGILGGKDRKGSEWLPCPTGYVGPSEQRDDHVFTDTDGSYDSGSESDSAASKSDITYDKLNHDSPAYSSIAPSLFTTLSGSQCTAPSLFIPLSGSQSTAQHSTTTSTFGLPSLQVLVTSVSGAGAFHLSSGTTTVSAAQQTPILSTSGCQSVLDEQAELEQLRKQCEALEDQAREQAKLFEEQRLSAERVELRRKLQMERERLEMLQRSGRSTNVGQHQLPVMTETVQTLRQQSQLDPPPTGFQNFYGGPNMKEIRKVKGLRGNAEKVLESVRTDIPSLGHRPTASHNGVSLGARPKHQPSLSTIQQPKSKADLEYEEFLEFKAWRDRSAAKQGESDSDASPPRVTSDTRQPGRKNKTLHADPATDPSSSEEDAQQPVVLVYRRDQNGVKYRSYEPYQKAASSAAGSQVVKYTWVTDLATGREYKREVPVPKTKHSKQQSFTYRENNSRHVDHRAVTITPETGHRRGVRSPSYNGQHQDERVPGIIPLQDKEGKLSDKKTPTVIDWAKNCPVAYAEKVKYDEMNLPIYVWAFVSEILSSRTGLTPDMPRGELEARLQHLLCVLQVALVNSEKTDFNSKGWSIASVYAKRVQQKLDRGLETWGDFKRFGHDPHPSEMFTAKTEVEKRVPIKKTRDDRQAGTAKKMCTTWNNCAVERKCQYLVDNPSAAKCYRSHDCSYCLEKGHGTFNHQRRFCKKRRDAGDD